MPGPVLRQTPLHDLHVSLGGRMVDFAGWSMPVQFQTGVTVEHLQCRASASLFDVSHMGQLSLRSDSGARAVLAALETVMPADLIDLGLFQQRYALLTNPAGGIRDDCMVTRRRHDVLIVVNASNTSVDIDYLRETLPPSIVLTPLTNYALIALQGPQAVNVLRTLDPSVDDLGFMTGSALLLAGVDCFGTRSGYTGEDGFEISVPADSAEHLARLLCRFEQVEPAGLAARDTLRLEAGLCLHGHDISPTTSPMEAALGWAVAKVRRSNGERAGGYPGADVIDRQLSEGAARRRVGLVADERTPIREGTTVFNESGTEIGVVTSGTVTPTVAKPIAMAYVDTDTATTGVSVFAEVRGKRVLTHVTALPFVPTNYVRKPSISLLNELEQS